uniref:Uncharacterized protein n=1 Tax=Arundo donax TaxID=35708 RepID=A0A0A9EH89_ARUDO
MRRGVLCTAPFPDC